MLTQQQLKQLRSEPLIGPNKVRRAKELAETTQVEIAAATGLSQPVVSSVERGEYSRLPLETARALAKHYGCHIEDLFPSREAIAS